MAVADSSTWPIPLRTWLQSYIPLHLPWPTFTSLQIQMNILNRINLSPTTIHNTQEMGNPYRQLCAVVPWSSLSQMHLANSNQSTEAVGSFCQRDQRRTRGPRDPETGRPPPLPTPQKQTNWEQRTNAHTPSDFLPVDWHEQWA